MAKMFYTMEETKASLGRNEEEIKQLAREGRLREFRDGPRLMFKADQVEQLKGELGGGGGGDSINISHGSESGAPIGLAGDSKTGSSIGSGIALVDNVPSPVQSKGDTHIDIGLSGSLGGSVGGSVSGIPSPGRSGPRDPGGSHVGSGSGILNLGSGAGSGGSRAGITVFDVDDSQKVDPSAQTAINPSVQDQINLEGVGSGSGLLDLTRESDDTSLGAVFDELTPGARRTPSGHQAASRGHDMETQAGADFTTVAEPRTRGTLSAPIYIEAADPQASALGAMSLAVVAVLIFGAFILGAALMGYRPEVLDRLDLRADGKMWMALAAGVTLVAGAIGFVVGKMGAK
jgi:hypothetical protein